MRHGRAGVRDQQHHVWDGPGSAARPVLNVRTRVVDPAMVDWPPEIPGEIVHQSPQLLLKRELRAQFSQSLTTPA